MAAPLPGTGNIIPPSPEAADDDEDDDDEAVDEDDARRPDEIDEVGRWAFTSLLRRISRELGACGLCSPMIFPPNNVSRAFRI